MVHALDYNSTQVLIEARFVEISDQASRSLGVNWGVLTDDGNPAGNYQAGGVVVGTGPNTALSPAALLGGANGGISLGYDLYNDGVLSVLARVSALEEKGDADTLSEPKVLTLSNRQAIIDLRTEVPYVSDYEDRRNEVNVNTGGSGNINDTEVIPALVPVIESDYEGITLLVRPSVARNSDIVTMDIAPVVRDILEIRQFPFETSGTFGETNLERPIVGVRQTQTTLHVRDGETVVLGGLITADQSSGRNGVPGLMDVPGFGALFRNTNSRHERRKLLIFVTAHIIDPTGARMTDEIRHLRDTARITLRPEVQAALHDERSQTEQTLRELDEASRNQVRQNEGGE